MPEHEMQAAEVHELVVEQEIMNRRKSSVNPDKVNLDLGFGQPVVGDEKLAHDSQNDSEHAYSDTADGDEPNEQEKIQLRRGV
jgi:hypothetical protein